MTLAPRPASPSPPSADALEQARQLDADAWEALYREVYPALHAFCRRRVADDHEADDLVAEVMARAVAGIDGYQHGPAGVVGWLFGIARNVVHERWRTQARDARWEQVGPALVGPDPDGPLDQLLDHEERCRVVAAFARLDEGEREVLELRVTAGLDAGQVAQVLGKQPGAVRMAQSRAIARLRTFMEEVT